MFAIKIGEIMNGKVNLQKNTLLLETKSEYAMEDMNFLMLIANHFLSASLNLLGEQ